VGSEIAALVDEVDAVLEFGGQGDIVTYCRGRDALETAGRMPALRNAGWRAPLRMPGQRPALRNEAYAASCAGSTKVLERVAGAGHPMWWSLEFRDYWFWIVS
jgi:hypothetical protein